MVNTAILGAFVRATGIVDMASIERVIRGRFSNNTTDINLTAMIRTYKVTQLEKTR